MFALEIRCSLDNRIQQLLIVSRIINRLLFSSQLLASWSIWNHVIIIMVWSYGVIWGPKRTSFAGRACNGLWLLDCNCAWRLRFLNYPSISFSFAQLSPSWRFISSLLHWILISVAVSLKTLLLTSVSQFSQNSIFRQKFSKIFYDLNFCCWIKFHKVTPND